MGRLFLVNLEGKSYSCRHYKTNLALCEHVVSKTFQFRHGKAYLFSKVANVYAGKNIYCVKCGSYVGWRYEFAFEKNQKYKEGKSVLERYKVWGPDGTIIGWLKKLKPEKVILMNDDLNYSYLICTFSQYSFHLSIIIFTVFFFFKNHPSSIRIPSEINCLSCNYLLNTYN